MKMELIVGLIGGIVAAIIATVTMVHGAIVGAYTFATVETFVKNQIPINFFWGATFSLLYSKIYKSIPGKGIWKGLVYGLMIYFLSNIYMVSYYFVYGDPSLIISVIPFLAGIWTWAIYGFVLGYLYEKVIIK